MNTQDKETIRAALYRERRHIEMSDLDKDHERRELDRIDHALDALKEPVWTPLPDGKYTLEGWNGNTCTLSILSDGADLEMWSNKSTNILKDGTPLDIEEIGVGEFRLCQKQEKLK